MTPLSHLRDREEAREVLRRLARSHHVRLAAAAARGTCRRPEVVEAHHATFRELRRRGWADHRTARALGLHHTTVRSALLDYEAPVEDAAEAFRAGDSVAAIAARTGRHRLHIEQSFREAMRGGGHAKPA